MNGIGSCLIDIIDLKVYFPLRRGLLRQVVGYVKAVDGVSFELRVGKTLGLVGESGCGKSTIARTLVKLIPITSGTIKLESQDISALNRSDVKNFRTQVQIVFQDPYSSLNPRMTVYELISEGLFEHNLISSQSNARRKVDELLNLVGLSTNYVNRYPHEFSGGQRQRIAIARALAVDPRVLILDEPVSALDVSIQAQILNLLADLQDRLNVGYLFISHDLSVVNYLSDRVAVMYLGQIVEEGDNEKIFNQPAHPYTQALISAAPLPKPAQEKLRALIPLEGDVPSPINPPGGCRFAPRCPLHHELQEFEKKQCIDVDPLLKASDSDRGHLIKCHYFEQSRGRITRGIS